MLSIGQAVYLFFEAYLDCVFIFVFLKASLSFIFYFFFYLADSLMRK